jgi:hypothetical protein
MLVGEEHKRRKRNEKRTENDKSIGVQYLFCLRHSVAVATRSVFVDISFTYQGTDYVVGHEAFGQGLIVLPDKRTLEVSGWKRDPPRPVGLKESPHMLHDFSAEHIAEQTMGALARVKG